MSTKRLTDRNSRSRRTRDLPCWNCKGKGKVELYDPRDPDPTEVLCEICGGIGTIPYMGYVAAKPAAHPSGQAAELLHEGGENNG